MERNQPFSPILSIPFILSSPLFLQALYFQTPSHCHRKLSSFTRLHDASADRGQRRRVVEGNLVASDLNA